MDAAKMYIHLFDSFTIEYQGEILNMREHLSRQSLSLLEVSCRIKITSPEIS